MGWYGPDVPALPQSDVLAPTGTHDGSRVVAVNGTILFLAAIGESLQRFAGPLARELSARGFRCVAVAGKSATPPSVYRDFHVVREITPFRRGTVVNLAAAGRDLEQIIRAYRPRLLHLHTPYAVALGRVVGRLTRTRQVAVVRGTLFDCPTAAGRLFSAVEVSLARLTPVYVTLNPDDRATYRRLAPRSAVHLASCGGMGIDTDRFSEARVERAARFVRVPRVLMMGRLTIDKNFDLAVAAWRLAKRSVPDLELRIVGSTFPGEPAWIPPMDPGLTVSPWTGRPDLEYGAADVLLSASGREGFPMTVAEALHVGVPVVAVDNRGTRAICDLVDEGLSLVPARAAAISAALLTQLRAGTVRIPPSVLQSWTVDSVVAYHVNRVLDAID